MMPSRKCTWRTGNFSKMGTILNPLTMPHRHFLLLPIRQGYEDRRTKTGLSSMSNLGTPHQHRDPLGKQLGNPMRHLEALRNTQGTSAFWENSEAPLPLPKRRCNFIHPKQLSPFPERLELQYPDGEILSGYEEDVSFFRDRFTTLVKADPNDTSERPLVDVRKAFAEYREASVRRQEAPSQEYFFVSSVPNRSSVHQRLSVYNWNPGPRRGKEGAIEKQIAGKWHITTLQEAIDCVDHELLTNRFHVTSMVLRGGAATGTISVPSKKPLSTALCRCLLAPHHCGDPDRFRAIGLKFVGSLKPPDPVGTGMYGFMVPSPFRMKSWACARQLPSRSLLPPRLCWMAQRTATP